MVLQRKKLDSRIPLLISNGVKQNHRTFLLLVGDRGKDQIVTLHFLLSKARITTRPSVLWCYKKELGFTTHRKKRMNQIKKQISRGLKQVDEEDPFELFITSTDIRYTYYKETENILGNTYGMCVLQDFEAMTPNILARTIETVEGGGIVVILLKTMASLKQLYSMNMDVHSRYRTESHNDTTARFNERFLLSLGNCDSCLVLDDELNVLPLSAGKDVKPSVVSNDSEETPEMKELKELKASLLETQPAGSLVSCTKTTDQAKAVLTFIDAISEKKLKSTVALTAARGRGKSAALGIAMASAISYGYSNIFITSPSPENLKTLFEFCLKGLKAVGYEEHLDFDIVKSSEKNLNNCIVRLNIFKEHRQTIQYISPSDHHKLSQAELLIIDEAAAIPLPIVKQLLGPYLVFIASTINGYEGTGRSLSLKLFQQLREQSAGFSKDGKISDSNNETSSARVLREIQLSTPIRYGANDSVEAWLNQLLCLECSTHSNISKSLSNAAGMPHPSSCDLYYVNRDTLFSYHPVSETFLQRMMTLYVASHYKNSPNDLQLMSDAPAHNLFVLLPPVGKTSVLPDPIVVLQICMEGSIAKESALRSLERGVRQAGDLIPWVVSQQFQDDDFASLNGARVVRIATHPDYIGMGYGKKAMELLEDYYKGKVISLEETSNVTRNTYEMSRVTDDEIENKLLNEEIKVRDASKMPPLLLKLCERPLLPAEKLHWLGVSFGLTPQLQKFWKKLSFSPVYVRQTANDLTGEHTCIVIKSLIDSSNDSTNDSEVVVSKASWVKEFSTDFKKRFLELLSYQLTVFPTIMALSVIESCQSDIELPTQPKIDSKTELYRHYTPYDLKRLQSYSRNLLDYHVIQDLVPLLARHYFSGMLQSKTESVHLSSVQSAIICGMGLQKKIIETLEKEFTLSISQILALFAKSIKKISNYFDTIIESQERKEIEQSTQKAPKQTEKFLFEPEKTDKNGYKDVLNIEDWDPTTQTLYQDLEKCGNDALLQLKKREMQKEIIDSLDLTLYEIKGKENEWENVKMGKDSKIVNIVNNESTKKRKKKSVAADMAAEFRGDQTGVYDPKQLSKDGKKIKKNKKH